MNETLRGTDLPARPAITTRTPVSVVMPVRDEQRHLTEAVGHVLAQEYPAEVEVVLAVGPSRDATEAIAQQLAAADPRVTVVANPSGLIPAANNVAIKASRHPIVARVDGHALIPPGYLRQAVATLQETGADNVGGIMAAEGVTPFEQAVAWAMTSPAGVGSAGQAVLPLRPLAPGGLPPARGHHQPALPRPAGDAARDHGGPGGGPRRPRRQVHRPPAHAGLADARIPRASALPGRDPGGHRNRGPRPGQAGAGPPAGRPHHHAPRLGFRFPHQLPQPRPWSRATGSPSRASAMARSRG